MVIFYIVLLYSLKQPNFNVYSADLFIFTFILIIWNILQFSKFHFCHFNSTSCGMWTNQIRIHIHELKGTQFSNSQLTQPWYQLEPWLCWYWVPIGHWSSPYPHYFADTSHFSLQVSSKNKDVKDALV